MKRFFDEQYPLAETTLKSGGTEILRLMAFVKVYASTLFSIWLGSKLINESLKKELLGLK